MLQAGKNLSGEIFSFDAGYGQHVAKLSGELRDSLLDQRLQSIGELEMFDIGRNLPSAILLHDLPFLTGMLQKQRDKLRVAASAIDELLGERRWQAMPR